MSMMSKVDEQSDGHLPSSNHKTMHLNMGNNTEFCVQTAPHWTNNELSWLMCTKDDGLAWDKCALHLAKEFGNNHPDGFFTAESCEIKYRRLTGESQGKVIDENLRNWIKQFLEGTLLERFGDPETAKSARLQRYFELMKHASNDHLTDDQLAELLGVNEYNKIVNAKLSVKEQPDAEERKVIDGLHSKLSSREWKYLKNCNELVQTLRERTATEMHLHSRLPAIKVIESRKVLLPIETTPGRKIKSSKVKAESSVNETHAHSQLPAIKATPERNVKSPKIKVESSATETHLHSPAIKATPKRNIKSPKVKAESSVSEKSLLLAINQIVMEHGKAFWFDKPVNEREAFGYYAVIKHPIDLSNIERLIRQNKITNSKQLGAYYDLMYANAVMYNGKGHDVAKDGYELKVFCDETIRRMKAPGVSTRRSSRLSRANSNSSLRKRRFNLF